MVCPRFTVYGYEAGRLVFGWRGTRYGGIGKLDTRHLIERASKLFPGLKSVNWQYHWAGYVGITRQQKPMLIRLAENAYAGLGYNGRGITMATMMGKQLSQVLQGKETGIPVQSLSKFQFHPLYPVGVTKRLAYGHFKDRLIRRL